MVSGMYKPLSAGSERRIASFNDTREPGLAVE